MRLAKRLDRLPPYMFAELDRKIAEKRAEGVDVISLGVGDPDQPTPPHIVEALQKAAEDPSTHQYPSYYGMPELRQAVAEHYRDRFGVSLDPDAQVQPLIGSKEGLAHVPIAFVDPGDETLVPDPGYPVYATATTLAGGEPVTFPMSAASGFRPDFGTLPVSERTRILWLNYPSNPTAAVADLPLFEEAVAFARAHDVLVVHDAAYSEMTYEGYSAPSILQVEGAVDVALEIGSISKTHNMTGWRVGWAVGNPEAVKALAQVKTNIDSGIFNAVQMAAIAALTGPQDHLERLRTMYQRRRDLVIETLHDLGWSLEPPKGSFYIWFPTKDDMGSVEFCDLVLQRTGVVISPGSGYGAQGEGYVRISLTVPDERLAEAMGRIREALA